MTANNRELICREYYQEKLREILDHMTDENDERVVMDEFIDNADYIATIKILISEARKKRARNKKS